jgi:hypothetical protein
MYIYTYICICMYVCIMYVYFSVPRSFPRAPRFLHGYNRTCRLYEINCIDIVHQYSILIY